MDSSDSAAVAALHREWIFGWDIEEGAAPREFSEVFGRFYDFGADVILYDEADAQHRTFRRVQDYADAFWPGFTALRSAAHAVEEEPEALVSGDLAATRMVFIAVLTAADGTVTSLRCPSSQVWRRTADRDWHIVRDQTAIHPLPLAEAERFFS
jgi:ketosteroid isomerase-like protein